MHQPNQQRLLPSKILSFPYAHYRPSAFQLPSLPASKPLEYLLRKHGRCPQFFFDADELVVFGESIAARHGTALNLAAVYTDNEIGDKCILGLTGAVRYYCAIADLIGQFDRVQCFGNGPDLVQLY